MAGEERPAFYALRPGGWRDYVTLLHPPYTAWHLSYVAIGAATAPHLDGGRLGASALAFFLGVGLAAHALDELSGRPLATRISDRVLWAIAVAGLAGAVALGILGVAKFSAWLTPFVTFGAFIVLAYNLELAGGRFHTDVWFAIGWGGFPLLTAYFAAAEAIRPEAVLGAVFASALSLAQRRLSKQVRDVRRNVIGVSGRLDRLDGRSEPVTRETLARAHEGALRAMAVASVALAGALLLMRLA